MQLVTRWNVWLMLCLCALTLVVSQVKANQSLLQNKPNIVVIMVDDLGIGDLSYYKNPIVETPNIDQLADRSVRFDDFSVTPVCATTRASFLTGKNAYRAGVSGVHGGRDYLGLEHTLISEVLQRQGYRTGMWGKWHSGKSYGYLPHQRGFDDSYMAKLYQHENTTGWLNGKRVHHKKWVSEVISDYAIDFVNESGKKPFFAFLSFLAPHEPWLAPEQFVGKYLKKGASAEAAKLYGMIEQTDAEIGRFIKHLDKTGKLDDTVVIFMSDNGPWLGKGKMSDKEWQVRNALNLRGWKARNWQNGVRSPLFISQNNRFQPSDVSRFVDITDIAPTIAALAGTALPDKIDGYSILPILEGDKEAHLDRVTMITTHGIWARQKNFNQWTPITEVNKQADIPFKAQGIALRNENFKLVQNPVLEKNDNLKKAKYMLFDVKQDPSETLNIIGKHPKLAEKMKKQLAAYYADIIADPLSLKPPVHSIFADSISVINAYAPSAMIGEIGGVGHYLAQLANVGTGVKFNLNVDKSGNYQVILVQNGKLVKGARVRVSSDYSEIESELSGQEFEQLGLVRLNKGLQPLSLIMAKSSFGGELIKARHILLLPENTKFSPKLFDKKLAM